MSDNARDIQIQGTVTDMMRSTSFTIRGLAPLLMHNGRLVDKLDDFTKALAKATKSKSKDTEQGQQTISELEWRGSLYTDEDNHPCLPGEVLEAMLVEGAKVFKLGKACKGALIVDGNYKIKYDGPKTVDGLWKDGGFLKRSPARVGQQRIIRSRPIFPKWECTFDVQWDPDMIKDEEQLADIVESAGRSGVGDWRPKFGRFEVVE